MAELCGPIPLLCVRLPGAGLVRARGKVLELPLAAARIRSDLAADRAHQPGRVGEIGVLLGRLGAHPGARFGRRTGRTGSARRAVSPRPGERATPDRNLLLVMYSCYLAVLRQETVKNVQRKHGLAGFGLQAPSRIVENVNAGRVKTLQTQLPASGKCSARSAAGTATIVWAWGESGRPGSFAGPWPDGGSPWILSAVGRRGPAELRKGGRFPLRARPSGPGGLPLGPHSWYA